MRERVKILAINGCVLFVLYAVLEFSISSYKFFLGPPPNLWVFENVGNTMQFDPVKGYTLTQVPSRWSRITNGQIEYVGTLQGNAQGFPDRDDFTVDSPSAGTKRFAVFGDSFTAAQYIGRNWPDRVEDEMSRSVQLLNFAVDGGGLANWASIIHGILEHDGYKLDGLIFAVFGNDLERKFFLTDGRGRENYAVAYVPNWDPSSLPQTLSDANNILDGHDVLGAYIVSAEQFNRALTGQWQPGRNWEFIVWNKLRALSDQIFLNKRVSDAVGGFTVDRPANPNEMFVDGQQKLFSQVRDFAAVRNLPVTVVYIPGRETASGRSNDPSVERVRQFAKAIGGTFIDGRQAYRGMTADQIARIWLPFDGHWGQAGSDVFAAFMADWLRKWPQRRTAAEVRPQ